jgi:N4-(beta-N-acetylglucosaminyl)-L-asparaginase
LYCDGRFGAAACTGDGEEIMRTCLSFLVVEFMRQGCSVQEACRRGIERVLELEPVPVPVVGRGDGADVQQQTMYSKLTVGVIAMDALGNVSVKKL